MLKKQDLTDAETQNRNSQLEILKGCYSDLDGKEPLFDLHHFQVSLPMFTQALVHLFQYRDGMAILLVKPTLLLLVYFKLFSFQTVLYISNCFNSEVSLSKSQYFHLVISLFYCR
jgi:hypothetical protein